ncbi:MAG: ParB N-terminal domain-containing protein [Chloroflexota bacterium]|nr:ParB N-terminal domain-containing protein [Chloroflexota bacterium]
MPIAELAPAPYNPRKGLKAGDREYESLKRSIEEFGVVDPVIFNTRTKRLVGGHQRLTVLRDLGHATAPTVLVDLDEVREKALNLALNKIAGAWDMPMLKDLLLDIERSGGDQTLTGFDPKEIEEILTNYRDDDPGEDIPVPEPPANPVTRVGDLYELGPHRLVCGDARDGRAWKLLMGQDRADIMWTDPPYGVQPATGSAMRARGEPFQNNRPGDIQPLLSAVFPLCSAHLKAGAAIYVCSAPDADMLMPFIGAFLAAQWHHSRTLIWVKGSPNFLASSFGGDYKNQHEAILYGWKPGAAHVWNVPDGAVIDDEPALTHMKREDLVRLVKELRNDRQTSVVREDKTRHNDLHPTMKPIPLIRRMLANSSVPKQLVLEPFAGSGSTLIAAAQMGRRARLMEIEPRFCDVIVERWQNLTKETAKRIPAAAAA